MLLVVGAARQRTGVVRELVHLLLDQVARARVRGTPGRRPCRRCAPSRPTDAPQQMAAGRPSTRSTTPSGCSPSATNPSRTARSIRKLAALRVGLAGDQHGVHRVLVGELERARVLEGDVVRHRPGRAGPAGAGSELIECCSTLEAPVLRDGERPFARSSWTPLRSTSSSSSAVDQGGVQRATDPVPLGRGRRRPRGPCASRAGTVRAGRGHAHPEQPVPVVRRQVAALRREDAGRGRGAGPSGMQVREASQHQRQHGVVLSPGQRVRSSRA